MRPFFLLGFRQKTPPVEALPRPSPWRHQLRHRPHGGISYISSRPLGEKEGDFRLTKPLSLGLALRPPEIQAHGTFGCCLALPCGAEVPEKHGRRSRKHLQEGPWEHSENKLAATDGWMRRRPTVVIQAGCPLRSLVLVDEGVAVLVKGSQLQREPSSLQDLSLPSVK